MLQRLASAIILIILLLSLIYWLPNAYGYAGLILLSVLFVYEIASLLKIEAWLHGLGLIIVTAVLVTPSMINHLPNDAFIIPIAYAILISTFSAESTWQRGILFLFICAMIIKMASVIILLHQVNQSLVIGVIALVAICDSFAYFVGRLCGKTPLMPSISPNKTWEGVIGGGVGVTITLGILFSFSWIQIILAGLAITSMSVIGDLLQSAVKRKMQKKDSGYIIPGHGGLYDRLDSHLFLLAIGHSLIVTLKPF